MYFCNININNNEKDIIFNRLRTRIIYCLL